MSLFFDRAGLIAELRTSNLSSAIQEKVVQQARAAIAFKRCLRDMETVKVGVSRLGGLPDWPLGQNWPIRKKSVNATSRVLKLKAEKTRNAMFVHEMKMSYELLNEGRKLLGQPAEDFDEEKYRSVQQRLLTETDIRIENHLVDFPLAFVAQLNLSDLALLPGFDPLLPRRGLLSFFVDITWEDRQPFVFWHDVEVDTLSTLAVPDDLLAFYNKIEFREPWQLCTQVECLEPLSVISVPSVCEGLSVTQQKAYESWYDALSDYEQDNPYRVDACYSGDLLGGWTIPLQRSVEDELNQNDTRWRQLFSWDEEIHSTTALLAVAGPDFGGGIDYIMMTEKDMAAQCFDRVRNVVQLD
ncbi:DUF1963 domain-containing protein [Salmonella enterica]|nr:DUF1963 domain-containing protein [Salmonella enterica]